MATQPKSFLTPEQYLEIERKADFRSEYFNGEMFAMAGAQRAHNQLVASLIRANSASSFGDGLGTFTRATCAFG